MVSAEILQSSAGHMKHVPMTVYNARHQAQGIK